MARTRGSTAGAPAGAPVGAGEAWSSSAGKLEHISHMKGYLFTQNTDSWEAPEHFSQSYKQKKIIRLDIIIH